MVIRKDHCICQCLLPSKNASRRSYRDPPLCTSVAVEFAVAWPSAYCSSCTLFVDIFVFAWKLLQLKRLPSMWHCTSVEAISGGNSLSITDKYSEKQVSATTHPCLSVHIIGNG